MSGHLPAGLAEYVAAYAPTHVDAASWSCQSAAVREVALLSASTLPMAKKVMQALASFGAWLLCEGYQVDRDTLASADLIDRFVEVGMPGKAEGTRATRRSLLRRVAARISPESYPVPEAIAYRRARPPYTPHEVNRFFATARAQPSTARRHSLTAILTLGLGCGLHRQDLAWVRGSDISHSVGTVVVTVAGGPRPRTVPVLQTYAERVAACADRAGTDLLIGGASPGRRNVTTPTLDRVVQDASLPGLAPARLRSTWLVTHLNLRTPLALLLPAAGLASSRTLDDLLPYADPISPPEARSLLRGTIRPIAASGSL